VNPAQRIRENPKQAFLYVIALCYAVGFLLHAMDLFDMRLPFSHMERYWQVWIVYLLIGDFVTAVLLWRRSFWGIVGFQTIAVTQLIAYLFFEEYFGRQGFLVVFHVVTLATYWKIHARQKRQSYGDKSRFF